jgi:hypothetical protein
MMISNKSLQEDIKSILILMYRNLLTNREVEMKKAILVAVAILFLTGAAVRAEDYGVYVKVADKVEGSFDDAVKKIESALNENGWKVIASYDASVPERV